MLVIPMKWITREHAHVDRIACPWLIKHFIDRDAEFLFVAPDKVLDIARKEKGHSFDAPGAEFTHRDGGCSFETLVRHFNITDPAIGKLAKVVHGADVPEDVKITPESAGLAAIANGFALTATDDFDNMARQFPVYDALYVYFNREMKE
jgi:hypothetical protein